MSLLVILPLILAVVGLAALAWRDFVAPRRQRRDSREKMRHARRRGMIRSRILMRILKLRQTPMLTDQRALPKIDETD